MTRKEHVWVIDDDRAIRWVLEKALQGDGMSVTTFESAAGVLDGLKQGRPDAIMADIRMPGMNGLELLARLRERCPELPVIIMTAHSDLDSAVSAYQGGAFEYLPKPFDVDEAVALVRRACLTHRQRTEPPEQIEPLPGIIGEAPAMQEVFRAIGRLSRSNITVLITGESGTGKELVARALHRHSPRADKPFIAINTAAIPRDLLESELFGHERGAFTGAQAARQGRFEQANGGTLFLDEIGDMDPAVQAQFLKVIEEKQYRRLGEVRVRTSEFRLICATNQNLEERVQAGLFRRDLFFRINVFRVTLPALRSMPENLPGLVNSLLRYLTPRAITVDPAVYELMAQYPWPGNVRELRNVLERALVLSSGQLTPDHFKGLLKPPALSAPGSEPAALKLADVETIRIREAMTRFDGDTRKAADALGISRATLYRRLKDLKQG